MDPSIGKPSTPGLESSTLITGIDPITAKELTWAKQHVLWLYNKHKHLDQHGMLPVQCRIRAMTMRSRLRRDDWAKRYEQHTDEESDEDG